MDTDQDPPHARSLNDVGGTSGGLAEFVIGVALLACGAWFLLSRVVVMSSVGNLFGLGHDAFGVLLAPLFLGVVLLFWNGRSVVGWLLASGGALAIFAGIVSDLHMFFRPTSLVTTLAMFCTMAAGLGMVARGVRPH